MRFYSVVLASAIFLGGCSGSNAFHMFSMDKMHERAIEQLRTSSIVSSMQTKAIVSTLYLNALDSEKYKNGEHFLVSLYIERDNEAQKRRDLNNSGYTLTLNDTNATVVEKLDDNDARREIFPIKQQWNQYYYIRYDDTGSDRLKLKLQKDEVGQTELIYQKL